MARSCLIASCVVIGLIASARAYSAAQTGPHDGGHHEGIRIDQAVPASDGQRPTSESKKSTASCKLPTSKARAIVQIVNDEGPQDIQISAKDGEDGQSILIVEGADEHVGAVLWFAMFLDGKANAPNLPVSPNRELSLKGLRDQRPRRR